MPCCMLFWQTTIAPWNGTEGKATYAAGGALAVVQACDFTSPVPGQDSIPQVLSSFFLLCQGFFSTLTRSKTNTTFVVSLVVKSLGRPPAALPGGVMQTVNLSSSSL
jgi:hypothetical protein